MSKPNFDKMMQMAKELQDKMEQANKDLDKRVVKGESGGGLVKISMTARHDVRKVEIDPSIIKHDEKTMLEDLVAAAVNDANNKVERINQDMMMSISNQFQPPSDDE